jgi:hypothetical protein
MNWLNTFIFTSSLLSMTASFAQTSSETKTNTPTPSAQVAPKATKKDAKAQCRSEGKSGKALLDCIKARSQGE